MVLDNYRPPISVAGATPSYTLQKVAEALTDIGLVVNFVEGASGFLRGVRIVGGALHASPDCAVSDLLHEAGHLACIPGQYRGRANDDLDMLAREMLDDIDRLGIEPDSALYRAIIQCSDPEATAWAWAFGRHLGLEPEVIIEDHQYPDDDGNGTGAEVRLALSVGMYIGVHGLAHAGFCSANRFGRLPAYPKLAFWTQQA